MLSMIALAPLSQAQAADLPTKYKAATAIPNLPFFLVNDNRFTYAYIFDGTNPGVYSFRTDGSVNGKTAKQVVAFTHFDVWAYGTNFFNIAAFKSGHNDPAAPCTGPGNVFGAAADCAGSTEIYGLFRSTIGFNEVFNTKAFSYGPLRNVSLQFGADANTQNTYLAPAKKDIVVGLQFAFELPYKGYLNVSPLYYKEWNHNGFLQCGSPTNGGVPGVSCLSDGNTEYKGTWAVETNYYMDLGFLPESMQYFSISGRAGWYGKKGDQNAPLPAGIGTGTAVELNAEPIRLTFDASKLMWGPKYTHFVDVWVAYRYWQNKFGLDHKASPGVCTVVGTGQSTNTCIEESVYAGVTVKF